jgi:hypothetical protein
VADHEQVREAAVGTARALLLGPLESDETMLSSPADTYLTGILWPEGTHLDAIEDDQDDGAVSSEDSGVEIAVPGYRAIRPCSLGMTFAADVGCEVVIDLGATARYVPVEIEAETTGGRPRRAWRRQILGYRTTIAPGPARRWRNSDYVLADGTAVSDPAVQLHFRRRIDGDQQVLTVTLINAAIQTDDQLRDALCLFQTEIHAEATSKAGAGAIRPRASIPLDGADEDTRSAALLYRDAVEFAIGHGVAACWPAAVAGRVNRVWTSWLPGALVKGMSADGHPSLAGFHAAHPRALDAAWLARREAREEVIEALRGFATCYRTWIGAELEPRVNGFEGALGGAARRNLAQCHAAADRIDAGINMLAASDTAWQAFVLTNASMDRQSRYEAKGERRSPLRWRPFQLAYILLVIPGLANPSDADRDCVDLLWFPTGGGKTEAYLALTAFEIFLRRLTRADRRDDGGVDVLMRYTLRLLTVQQFQRATSLICACDAIRRETSNLGDAPITIGLYVGDEATPNRAAATREALIAEHDGQQPRSTPRQLLNCPVCGNGLPATAYNMSPDDRALDIVCGNAACATAGRPLPVLVTDELIYASPPSLLIGTIDKFAQLPRRRDLRALFGLDADTGPGLIIQDELHLISGPLGSMAGLYETIVDLLCTRDGVRPKVIGSTATIGQAARQVRALFDRGVLQFPPAGFDAADSFFAVRDEEGPDRLYLGLSSAGRSPKFALQAAAAAFLQAAGAMRQAGTPIADLDPFWTCVLYFNSLRELGGAHVLMQDDVPRQMEFLAPRLQSTQRHLEAEPVELSSRVPSRELPAKLDRLGVGLDDGSDPYAPVPEDTVLASNMISVGVDVPRLGLMIVNGQPKSTAEYIQASSRIGRGLHGVVLTLYNFGRPRDVSHFEHFNGYHAALYRSVEATSVTPWAPRARDKALHAVLAASVRHLVANMESDEAAGTFDVADPEVQRLVAAIEARAASASLQIEGVETAADLAAITREWAQRVRDSRAGGRRLLYWERPAPFGATLPHLMTSAEEGNRRGGLAWPTPNSLREVEPSTAFRLKTFNRS